MDKEGNKGDKQGDKWNKRGDKSRKTARETSEVEDKCKITRPRVSKHGDKQSDKWRQVHPAKSV